MADPPLRHTFETEGTRRRTGAARRGSVAPAKRYTRPRIPHSARPSVRTRLTQRLGHIRAFARQPLRLHRSRSPNRTATLRQGFDRQIFFARVRREASPFSLTSVEPHMRTAVLARRNFRPVQARTDIFSALGVVRRRGRRREWPPPLAVGQPVVRRTAQAETRWIGPDVVQRQPVVVRAVSSITAATGLVVLKFADEQARAPILQASTPSAAAAR